MYKRTIGSFTLAKALFVVLLTSAVLTRAAGTATGQFIVQATVKMSCSVAGTENINFGDIPSPVEVDLHRTAQIAMGLNCPYLFPPQPLISLDKGRGAGATFAQRKMTSSSNVADTLNYTLYTDALTVWGDGTEGSSQHRYDGDVVTIDAVIPKGQAPAAGSYQDTIVVTVSF